MSQPQQPSSEKPIKQADDLDPHVARRLVRVREALERSQEDFSEQMGVSRRAYQRYEAGERSPKLRQLQGLISIGIDLNWLLTGQGQMLRQPDHDSDEERHHAPTDHPKLDGDLMGRIVDTIRAVHKAESQELPDRFLGEMAAEWYDAITAEASGPGDRLDALAERQIALRRRLRAASANPTADKRPA